MIRRLLLLAVLAAGVLFIACEDGTPPQHCQNIPAGGCPLSGANACEDPSCSAVYACRADGTWLLDHACGPHDAGAVVEAASPVQRDASIDAPPGAAGGPGCVDLQPPDCPLATALACSRGCCDCEDLFVCQNGGWSAWGTCGDAGVTPR